jgi:hypothetical protein
MDKSIQELYNQLGDIRESLSRWEGHRNNASTTEEAIYADCRMIDFETKYSELKNVIKLALNESKVTA